MKNFQTSAQIKEEEKTLNEFKPEKVNWLYNLPLELYICAYFRRNIRFNKNKQIRKRKKRLAKKTLFTYNVSVSFQTGLSDALMVFVFFLTLSVSGMSFILT